MSNTNSTTLIGNLVADPELRYTTTEKPVCNARLAVNERINIDGNWSDRTNYLNMVVWGQQGENFAASCAKGDRVIVTGRIQIRPWETNEGNKAYFTEVVVEHVGVSLQFAEAIVEKNSSTTPASQRQHAAIGAGAGDAPVYGDEEPF